MARGITEQDVFEAADALLARGERPTIDRVRQQLGGGSPNTINPHLDTWWNALGKRVGGVQAPGLPASLLQAMTKLYEEMRREVVGEAERLGKAQAAQNQEAQHQLEQDRAALAAEKAGVLATVEKLRGDLAGLREANQGLVRRNGQLEADLAAAQQRFEEAALQVSQANAERERAALASRAELERVRDQWQGNERRWLGEIDHLRDEAKRFRGEHDRSQKTLLGRVETLEQQLSEGAKERAALRLAVDKAERELAKEREKRHFAEGALAASRAGVKSARSPSNRSPSKQRRATRGAQL